MRRWLIRLAFLSCAGLFGLGAVYLLAPERLVDAEYARWAWMAGMTQQTMTVGDQRISYYEGGHGAPVVLVHGFSGSKENWLQMAGKLGGRYRVLIPDLPGWGESSRVDGADYGVAAQVERLVQLLDAWGVDRVHLVGHSMGGHIAGVFAARHPERVLDVVLVAPAGLHFTVNPFAQQILDGGTPFNVDTVEQYDQLLHTLFVHPPWLPPRAMQVLVDRNVANHAFHASTLAALKRGEDTFLLERSLADLPPLTRVVWCSGDRVLDVSSLDVVKQKRPDIPTEVLAGCGHMPMMEVPAITATAIARGFVLN